jgi:NADH-quinone oxidoreductase subunit G
VILPLELADMPDSVVWVPTNAPGYPVRERLAAGSGAVVRVSRAQVTEAAAATTTGPDATGPARNGAATASGGA